MLYRKNVQFRSAAHRARQSVLLITYSARFHGITIARARPASLFLLSITSAPHGSPQPLKYFLNVNTAPEQPDSLQCMLISYHAVSTPVCPDTPIMLQRIPSLPSFFRGHLTYAVSPGFCTAPRRCQAAYSPQDIRADSPKLSYGSLKTR